MFITFEGIEGSGKSTQVRCLVKRLESLHIPCVETFEPGGTVIGQGIRRILLDSRSNVPSPLAELFLYVADRAQHVDQVIRPALDGGMWVVCDRYLDATTVYQGYGRSLNMDLIEGLNRAASFGIRPDVTFLLDCPVEVGLTRALSRNTLQMTDTQDRFEKEKKDFHERIREAYLMLAKENNDRFVVIDATGSEEDLESAVWEHLQPLIPNEPG